MWADVGRGRREPVVGPLVGDTPVVERKHDQTLHAIYADQLTPETTPM